MPHTLDVQKLGQIFEALEDGAHKLSTWEMDRLPEWHAAWKKNHNARIFTDPDSKVMEIIERMYLKV